MKDSLADPPLTLEAYNEEKRRADMVRITDSAYDVALTLSRQELARQLVEAHEEIEKLHSAIAWMENLDPALVEAAQVKFFKFHPY